MKKFLPVLLAVSLIGGFSLPSVSYADVQIDEGQKKSQASIKFFIGRYARTGDIDAAFEISADKVVVWDTASDDGVTVMLSSTSFDATVAGVAMDLIPGSSRDYNATSDDSFSNWGRIQVWGRIAAVSYDNNQDDGITVGMRISQGGTNGTATIWRPISIDATTDTYIHSSRDTFGVSLDAPTGDTLDIFINLG